MHPSAARDRGTGQQVRPAWMRRAQPAWQGWKEALAEPLAISCLGASRHLSNLSPAPGPAGSTHSPRWLLDWSGCSRNQPSSCWAAHSFCTLTTTWAGQAGLGRSGLSPPRPCALGEGHPPRAPSTSGSGEQVRVLGSARLPGHCSLEKPREVPEGGRWKWTPVQPGVCVRVCLHGKGGVLPCPGNHYG